MERDGKADWDLDVVAGPRGAVLFALDLDYQPDPNDRTFRFGPPREVTLQFPLPSYLRVPAEVFRVDAQGVQEVDHAMNDGKITFRDRASRVAIYVVAAKPGERARVEARRRSLLAAEESLGFDPGRRTEDLAVLKGLTPSNYH